MMGMIADLLTRRHTGMEAITIATPTVLVAMLCPRDFSSHLGMYELILKPYTGSTYHNDGKGGATFTPANNAGGSKKG